MQTEKPPITVHQHTHAVEDSLDCKVVSFIFVYMRIRKRMREMKTKNEEDAAGILGGGKKRRGGGGGGGGGAV